MNVVLAIEAIQQPLAGIGRYAWELATRLPRHSEITNVRYISDGLWRNLPTEGGLKAAPASSMGYGLNLKGKLRRHLGQLPLVSRVYGRLAPVLAARSLSRVRDAVFHGPSYFLPQTDLPSVLTLHDLSLLRFPQWHPVARVERMRRALPESVGRANLILTDSEATRQEVMREFSLSAQQVQAVLLGVDASFYPRSAAELAPALAVYGLQPYAYSLFVSTIEPRKNLSNLLAAYRSLPASLRQRWPLVLAGGAGWQSEAIHAEIARAAAEGWLKYLGFVAEADLPLLYAGCRLFTYPSWYEGFGLPIAEAMASGVPVLTSNCSSMPEVAASAAMLVEPGDVASISNGLECALEDDRWRGTAIAAGLRRAAELSWDACVQNTVLAYRQALRQ